MIGTTNEERPFREALGNVLRQIANGSHAISNSRLFKKFLVPPSFRFTQSFPTLWLIKPEHITPQATFLLCVQLSLDSHSLQGLFSESQGISTL